jgi:archaellum biogenesis ATPase FlaH
MALYKSTDLTNKTVKLISKFQSGEIKPIPTGVFHLDKELKGGLLPGSIVGVIARSQHGKSYDLERIQRNIRKSDPDVVFVNGNYELNFFKILVRDICQRTGKTMDEVLFNNPSIEDLKKLTDICDSHRNENVYYQNEPVSPSQFYEDVLEVIKLHPDKKIVVTIDNLENILDTKGSQKASSDDFLTQINRLKDMHWFISFIILNQMNDDYIKRMSNIKDQKPLESDIYGTGQLLKLCDVLYIKILPWRLGIKDKFMMFPESFYEWLDEFKLKSTGKNSDSFDPIGVAYYFYLKRRVAGIKDIEDTYAERIFKRDEVKGIVAPKETTQTPSFSIPVFETPSPVTPNFDLKGAFSVSSDKEDNNNNNNSPF